MDTQDSETIREGMAEGMRYEVVQVRGGHYCGYVRTNFDDSWHYDDFQGYPVSLVDVHGGLTYGPDEDGWMGFDCAHAGNLCRTEDGEKVDSVLAPSMEIYDEDDDMARVWTPDDVAEECGELAAQVAEIQEFAEKVLDRMAVPA